MAPVPWLHGDRRRCSHGTRCAPRARAAGRAGGARAAAGRAVRPRRRSAAHRDPVRRQRLADDGSGDRPRHRRGDGDRRPGGDRGRAARARDHRCRPELLRGARPVAPPGGDPARAGRRAAGAGGAPAGAAVAPRLRPRAARRARAGRRALGHAVHRADDRRAELHGRRRAVRRDGSCSPWPTPSGARC